MNRISIFAVLSVILTACAVDVAPDVDAVTPYPTPASTGTGNLPPHPNLPPPTLNCPDDTAHIESDTDINTGATNLVSLSLNRTWIAWEYLPTLSHNVNKLCVASQAISEPTGVYLLEDNAGAPGAVQARGDLYNTSPGMLCTLDAPFNFTGAVVAGHRYWIASNAGGMTVARDGARIPYFFGDVDPASGAHWSYACSAGFVAKIGLTR